jgi:hypothetical protein
VTIPEDKVGWIGSWSPGIGDPTVAGWMTVALYVAAAWSCYRAAKAIGRQPGARDGRNREFWLWAIFSALLWALGLNKQLDMQTALTEIGRIMARQEGWYARRAIVQKEFIAILCITGATLAAVLLVLLRRLGGFAKTAALGMCFIGLFVLIRASSFHKVDRFLGSRLVHLRMNWILEMGGIAIVLLAALGRLRVSKAPAQRSTD